MATKQERFLEKLNGIISEKRNNSKILTEAEYQSIINDLKFVETNGAKSSIQYSRKSRYMIKIVNGIEKLIWRKNNLYCISVKEIYDVINEAHVNTGHGGRNVTEKELGKNYHNVSRELIVAYLNLCEECQLKRNKVRKSLVVKPIISNELNSRAQVDLIDMQSQPDGNFRFIMVYQEHLTKFLHLKALKTKTAEEVANQLVDIFCSYGAPHVLQSDNGREFANKLVTEVLLLWPECRVVHGKPRHSQSQGSVERANRDVQDKLVCWMRENQTVKWSEGLRFIQFQKNRAFHSGIGRCPYEAMFGSPPKVGLSTSSLSRDVLPNLHSEEDLEQILNPEMSTKIASENVAELSTNVEEVDISNDKICVSCQDITSGAHSCKTCKSFCHGIFPCSIKMETDDEGFGSQVLCWLCQQAELTLNQRSEAKRKQTEHADKVKGLSLKRFHPVAKGESVLVPIPEVD